MSKTYPHYEFGAKKATGTCMVCNEKFDKPQYTTSKKGKRWVLKPLTQLWEQSSWFRGEDELVGVVCPSCKSGKGANEIGEKMIKWDTIR